MSKPVFIAGLPRSGSTLLCNLLAQHPEIKTGPSSPLCHIVNNMRRTWSDDQFLLAQLDHDFDGVYKRLEDSTKAFIDTWTKTDTEVSLDKNRGWLAMVETLRALYPDFKMVVTIRHLSQVFNSVEKQHRKTLLLDFPDHMEHHLIDGRANALFGDSGIIGGPLKSIDNLADIPDIMKHIFFCRFEDIVTHPQDSANQITKWLELDEFKYDVDNVKQVTHESDGFYRMKYLHKVNEKIVPPGSTPLSPRIAQEINKRFDWYHKRYYPKPEGEEVVDNEKTTSLEDQIAKEIEEAL